MTLSNRIILPAVLGMAAVVAIGAAAAHHVSQKGKAFSVETLDVKVGDTVEFANDDDVAHNVFSSTKDHAFNLKTQAPGTASSTTFDKEGKVEVRCAIHPKMKMTVNVTK